MKKPLGNIVKFVVFLGLGLFLIWLITHDLTPDQWARIRAAFREANYWLLIPVFVVGTLSHLLRALRWRLLIEPLGFRTGVFTTFSAVMVGYMSNLAVPRMGEITRCGMLARYERLPVNKLIGTIIVERAVDLVCLIALITLTILIQIDIVGAFFYEHALKKVLAIFRQGNLLRIGLILAGGALLITLCWWVLRKFRHTAWSRRLQVLIKGVKTGVFSVGKLRRKKLFFAYTLLIWLCYFLMVYFGFWCFAATSVLGVRAGLSILTFGSVGMIATQGGIGAYQLIVEKTLELYGIAEVYGFAFGWLSWLAQTALIILLGFLCLLVLPFLQRKHRTDRA